MLGKWRKVLVVSLAIVGLVSVPEAVSAHSEPDDEHHEHDSALLKGSIGRDDLSRSVAAVVSDQAIEMVNSKDFEHPGARWNDIDDLIWQVDRQIAHRHRVDYMRVSPIDISRSLSNNSKTILMGLIVSDAEKQEFERRIRLGDKIPELEALLGVVPDNAVVDLDSERVRSDGILRQEPDSKASEEGGPLDDITLDSGDAMPVDNEGKELYPDNFGGIWQDQQDGGRLVVALVDPGKANLAELRRAAGGNQNVKFVRAAMSYKEVLSVRDLIVDELVDSGIAHAAIVNSLSTGKQIVVQSPDASGARRVLAKAGLLGKVSVVDGEPAVAEGTPDSYHGEADQQPGLQIGTSHGDNTCTWGVNAHTSTLNYIVTAGHCFAWHPNFSGWVDNTEVYQKVDGSNSRYALTVGRQYLKSVFIDRTRSTYPYTLEARDVARISSPQADSNCYHGWSSCSHFIKNRALHNSWETNSDWVCSSLGNTDRYLCGLVLEENVTARGACKVTQGVRYDIDTSPGDSGSGIISRGSGAVSIDAIHSCGTGSTGVGITAYHAKQELGMDFNCRSYAARHKSASWWGSCPTVNR